MAVGQDLKGRPPGTLSCSPCRGYAPPTGHLQDVVHVAHPVLFFRNQVEQQFLEEAVCLFSFISSRRGTCCSVASVIPGTPLSGGRNLGNVRSVLLWSSIQSF